MLPTLLILALGLFFLEVISALLVAWLRRDFQWLITRADLVPRIDKNSLERFLAHGFSPELGWERKPGTNKTEEIKTIGEWRLHTDSSTYTIGAVGERHNPGHEKLPVMISTYGDSFAFSRHVNDSQTWQWYLSELTGTNVVNYGVGNYGLDQACLRLESKFPDHPSRIVVMMVVPETISRIVNIWKHYSEYGNVLGFKGRFFGSFPDLRWMPNPVQRPEDFLRLDALAPDIQESDDCFRKKFRRDLLDFPYSVAWLRNPGRHIPLVAALFWRKVCSLLERGDAEGVKNRPWQLILERNFSFVRSLYQDEDTVTLMVSLVRRFNAFVKSFNAIPVFVLAPYLHDIYHLKKKGCYYRDFWNVISRELSCLDLAEGFSADPDPQRFFVSSFNAAHFSADGNREAARAIFEHLSSKKLMQTGMESRC